MDTFNSYLKSLTEERKSWLCVGLDIYPEAIGSDQLSDLKAHTLKVIDATRNFAIAYKPNFAFFERWGSNGFAWLEETVSYIGNNHIKIADAKRGDIGNTANQYAESIFNHFGFDAVTLNPYMGKDSVQPFIQYPEKGAFILCRTSNPSASDFQNGITEQVPLFEKVAYWANDLNINDNIGLVVGATATEELSKVRKISPDLSLLIPGVGVQGGNMETSLKISNQTGVGLINISRSINFAGNMSSADIFNIAEDYVESMRQVLHYD
tara:strand:- start:6313 stop:7110 length:798 start_codon:yes stop_codon:yes gene_type:complete